ncbi:MAG: S41 family peptidase [Muribaculaceae bacterium]|nr:S41 family peptidase [Muribaculaceae bacterium]
MNTKRYLPIILFLALASMMVYAQKRVNHSQKLRMAEYAINEFYVDTVDENKLVEDAIKAMLKELDPHSTYSDVEETKELTEPLGGKFSGIGIQFNMGSDTLYVLQTIAGGPSEKVGIKAGDRIMAVNDTTIAGVKMKTRDVMRRLKGKKGTNVDVKILRKGVKELIPFRIVRDDIPILSIDAAYMLDTNTGYIRISRFAETTYDEFKEAAKTLKNKGMDDLIIDLSDNGGGYLNIATEMANEFLSRGELIVYTEGRNSPRYDVKATGTGKLKSNDIVVIINQYSASASEILSGAIQDWDRGVIVGRRSFGKGLVQRPIPLPDGSMMRLTVARYYTPSGRSIQKSYEGGNEEYEKDMLNRSKHGEFTNADSIHFVDSLKYVTLKNQRTIYGGGGIMPDYFVPADTSEYSNYYRDIIAKGTLNQFIIDYIDNNRNRLKKEYNDIADFDKRYTVSDDMIQQLIKRGEKDSTKYDSIQFNRSKRPIYNYLKALVARDIFDNQAFYVITNKDNDLVKAALDIINDKKRYNKLLIKQ